MWCLWVPMSGQVCLDRSFFLCKYLKKVKVAAAEGKKGMATRVPGGRTSEMKTMCTEQTGARPKDWPCFCGMGTRTQRPVRRLTKRPCGGPWQWMVLPCRQAYEEPAENLQNLRHLMSQSTVFIGFTLTHTLGGSKIRK